MDTEFQKVNPKFFIKTWNERITLKYNDQIIKRDVSFFLNKDYENDSMYAGTDSNTLLKYINDNVNEKC